MTGPTVEVEAANLPGLMASRDMRGAFLAGALLAVLILTGCGSAAQTAAVTATSQPTAPPTPKSDYPPVTYTDLVVLAAEGNSSDARVVKAETTAIGGCVKQHVSVVLSPSLSAKQQVATLLRVFFDQGIDKQCGGAVFGYFDAASVGVLTPAPASVGMEDFAGSGHIVVFNVPGQTVAPVTY